MSAAYQTGVAANNLALFSALRTLMGANGWTEFDLVSDTATNKDIVFRGAPTHTGAANVVYLRITATNTPNWGTRCYADWDPVTHTGAWEAGISPSSTINPSSSTYWIRVNEFAVALCVKIGTTYYKMYGGYLRRGLPPAKGGVTKTTAAAAAGVTSVSVNTDLTAQLTVGQKVVIYNHANNSASANWGHAELVTVAAVTASTISFEGPTTWAYDSGAVIGYNPNPSLITYWASTEGLADSGAYATMFHDAYWSSNTSVPALIIPIPLTSETYADPDEVSLEYIGGVMGAYLSTAGRTGAHGYLYHWEACAYGVQVKEDIMTDGTDSFVLLIITTAGCSMLGPI